MKQPVILLTACINPNGMAYTVLQDSDERLRQYRVALDWYLQHVMNKIVFVENTGFDISPMYTDAIASGRLEVLTFQGNDFDKSKGKGYGEALIIEYALKNSKFLKEEVNVVKITGRLIIKNTKALLNEAKKNNTIYAKYASRTRKDVLLYESYFFFAPVRFLKDYFLSHIDIINDNNYQYFERVLHDSAKEWEAVGNHRNEFIRPIIVIGISGSTGQAYNQSRFPYFTSLVKWVYHKMPAYKNLGE